MTYVSCRTSIISLEGAAALEESDERDVDIEVANEVKDEDFFDEAFLVAKVEDEALLIDIDDVDFDFEADK